MGTRVWLHGVAEPGHDGRLARGHRRAGLLCGSPAPAGGLLDVAGRARGRLESWHKWSFPHGPPSYRGGDGAGWRPVSKRRRISWFSLAGGPAGRRDPGRSEWPGCAVELTEVHARGEAWWTLGFEATGPTSGQRSELEAAAALVFAQALPGGVELGTEECSSYTQWLRQRLDAGSDAGA
jgi:hypothetical protein